MPHYRSSTRRTTLGDTVQHQSQPLQMSSMQDYDEHLAHALGAYGEDDDDEGNADDIDTEQHHTQFLDLTNGEGGYGEDGTRFNSYSETDEEQDGTSAGDTIGPSTPGKVVVTGQEHTGRWTREEHAAFLSALKMHGKEWKKVAAKVKTRTVVQTRTHAQKYFQKLQKAMNGDVPGRVTSVEMGVDAKKASAQKKKKAAAPKPPQRMQSTASTHAAAHLMTNLSSAVIPTPTAAYTSSAYAPAPATYSSAPFATHGFSTASNLNDQPLLPPQALPSYPPSGGFFNRQGFALSIVAPEPSLKKFPEPSPAACGKRKLAELAAAHMLAGVAASGGDATPPPPEGRPAEPSLPSLGLQIVNPEALGVTFDVRRKRGEPSPTTPWDGQLQALVRYVYRAATCFVCLSTFTNVMLLLYPLSETRMKDDVKLSQEEDVDADVKPSAEGNGHPTFTHPVCGPASAFGRSLLHQAVCDMNVDEVNRVLSREDLQRRDDAGYCPLHTACALTMLGSAYTNVACDICQVLLSAGSDATEVDLDGNTALHWAARAGNERVAQLLLRNNCPPDFQNVDGETALHWAMRAGRCGMSVVCLLLDSGSLASVVNKQFKRPVDVAVDGFVDYEEKKTLDPKVKKSNKTTKKKLRSEVVEERREVRANFLVHSAQSRTLVLHHPECLEHVPKSDSDWEVPDRVNAIMRRILPDVNTTETTGIFAHEVTVSSEFDRAKLDLLSRVHSAEYLSFVNELSKDLERQLKEGMKTEEQSSGRMPAGVPFTPMVRVLRHTYVLLRLASLTIPPLLLSTINRSNGR